MFTLHFSQSIWSFGFRSDQNWRLILSSRGLKPVQLSLLLLWDTRLVKVTLLSCFYFTEVNSSQRIFPVEPSSFVVNRFLGGFTDLEWTTTSVLDKERDFIGKTYLMYWTHFFSGTTSLQYHVILHTFMLICSRNLSFETFSNLYLMSSLPPRNWLIPWLPTPLLTLGVTVTPVFLLCPVHVIHEWGIWGFVPRDTFVVH